MNANTAPDTNRRSAPRRQPKKASKFVCRRGKLGLGPNIAVALLDVSENGIRLIAKTPLEPDTDMEIGLQPIGAHRPTLVIARVMWCIPLADGNHCVGARFEKLLPYAFLQEVAHLV
ncbi:MAG TPA: PilZ domain-containing protein [Gemmataceae bacterium]|nr:PilZ domain-containing protein [Gemmataceae bacterium]